MLGTIFFTGSCLIALYMQYSIYWPILAYLMPSCSCVTSNCPQEWSLISVQYGACLRCCMLMKWNTSTNYKHTHPWPSEDPHELLELVCPLDHPLIEELLLAVECGHASDMFPNMDAITHPTFVVAPNSYLTDSCAPLECWLKRSIACLVTLNEAAHSQAGLRDQFPPCCRWRSALPRPCWAGVGCPHQVLYTNEYTVSTLV